ncbi:MAG: CvpA family protein [Proteobacteria bacterium]|nr:CvpA family protein [Pseudomonadota bacterium]
MDQVAKIAQYVDIAIYITTALAAVAAYRRGFLREGLIALIYIPYIAFLFYFINNFAESKTSFDAMIFKLSACGGFYLAALFIIYMITKALQNRWGFAILNPFKFTGNIAAAFISIFRTIYFILACMIFYHLQVNKPEYLEESKIAMRIYPHAVKISNLLLSNGILDNEITLYEYDYSSDNPNAGYSTNPILRKIQNSKKYKEYQESGMEDIIKGKVLEYMNKTGGLG